ncbi:hypothetical protein P1J78_16355 [Psychromarinibacter sp. C21-152]|uniref:Uncharacterized protein n=1 Tax=Psychromarinibacter sediminicola TaxID=3033385 RepID=A0AAE3NQF8_9RHOB|nr:hypothetical protein [Psychromarinibacter sediminicola]MDF0602313.1 hypothetical protein [Psychromarinibacter sediminicola]
METTELQEARTRLQLFASTIGSEAPERLQEQDGAPSREVLDFCRAHGASLDYIFCGDVRPLIRAAANRSGDFDKLTYRRAHDDVEYTLTTLSGLATALNDMARESNRISTPDDEGNALTALIVTIEEQAKKLIELHEVEWTAAMKSGAQPSPAAA